MVETAALRSDFASPESHKMSKDDRAVLLNARLLATYLRVSNAAWPKNDDVAVDEILAARDSTDALGDPALAVVFGRYVKLIGLHLSSPARATLEAALAASHVAAPPQSPIPPAFDGQLGSLGPIRAEGYPGISLVTCAMNRSENLIKALPSWLANTEISEVVIVDWSSDIPVETDLINAGIHDPRIRILRIDGEPRWVLTYAFNAGFRAAACEQILKVDADIVLSPDFFQRNHLMPGSFIAGNWRAVEVDQAHVNGFFFISRKALHQVGGFNEHITTYGWDDDDIYDRLTLKGFRRQDVAQGTVLHLPHDDAERLGTAAPIGGTVSLRDQLRSGTSFLIRRNRYIAMVMPEWDEKSIPLPFRMLTRTVNDMKVQREGWIPSRVPDHVTEAANFHALSELSAWRFGKRVLELGPERIGKLLDRPVTEVGRIDVELAIASPGQVLDGPGHYLVLDLAGGILDAKERPEWLDRAFLRLIAAARARSLAPVLRTSHAELPLLAPACLRLIGMIPSWEPIDETSAITFDALVEGDVSDCHLRIELTAAVLQQAALAAPNTARPRPRLFIDAQHGLGNRMRAVASAATIAAASDRELVLVWQPDDHCLGHFSDLFVYNGAIEDTQFLGTAPAMGCVVYNYMSNQSGATKGTPIALDTPSDIYIRASSVLNSPASTWEMENRFLQSLSPVAEIRALVAAVRQPNDVSAHVRMEGGTKSEHLTYEMAANWTSEDHSLIETWRHKSHFSHFLRRVDALIAEGRANRIFLAADMPETYSEFQAKYGARLAFLPRSHFDRSAEQLHYALADAILLSRSPMLLGSTWSSFSELAMRLAPRRIGIEMSGKDF